MKVKSAKGKDYYVLLCDCGVGEDRYMIMGVFASKKEALVLKNDIDLRHCIAKHTIKKVEVTVRWK